MRTLLFLLLLSLSSPTYSQLYWKEVYNNPSVTTGKFFAVNPVQWVLADSGKIIKSLNNGTNWSLSFSGNRGPFRDIFFINANTGWIAGGYFETWGSPVNKMLIMKTTNGGANWGTVLEDSDYWNVLNLVYFFDANIGVAFGSGGTGSGTTGAFRRTTDGGLSWTLTEQNYYARYLQKSSDGRLFRISTFADDVGRDTTYLHFTSDKGATWNVTSKLRKYRVFDFDILPDNSFLLTGSLDSIPFRGVLLKSTNEGTSWSMTVQDSALRFSGFSYVTSNIGWAVKFGSTYKTTNGGVSWNLDFPEFLSTYMFNPISGIGLASGGRIFKYLYPGPIEDITKNVSSFKQFSLSQNYPNPFNPATVISYQLPAAGSVSLIVYDALGNEVQRLVNEKQNAGSYSVDFNASSNGLSLPSGIYFYKLVTEKFSETKKMILIK